MGGGGVVCYVGLQGCRNLAGVHVPMNKIIIHTFLSEKETWA